MIIIGDIQHTNTTNNIIIGHWNWSQNNRKDSGGSIANHCCLQQLYLGVRSFEHNNDDGE
jgi:hypothetical protein